MNSKSVTKLVKQIDREMIALGKLRDRLDDAISEASEVKGHCEEAWDDLQRARDVLSQLV